MAIKLISTYSKKLGLPGYSSHSFGVTVESELLDTGEIQGEVARVYSLLQDAVDREVQAPGFVPPPDFGMKPNGSRASTPTLRAPTNNNGNGGRRANGSHWSCSPKQREFIIRICDENKLDRDGVDDLARTRFGKGVKTLNRVEASGLIDELLEQVDKATANGRNTRPAAGTPTVATGSNGRNAR